MSIYFLLYTRLIKLHLIKRTVLYLMLLGCMVFMVSCEQNTLVRETPLVSLKPEKSEVEIQKPRHPYGGWSCPDNLTGFPPINIKDLDKVPIVVGRLPTKEETRNGTSLMYIDKALYPNAKALDIKLPKLARYYSEYTKKNELVVVIQAVVVGQDSIIGFRNVNGGNGSAWLDEVTFLSEKTVEKLTPTPFVFYNREIKAPREKIWKVMTSPDYSRALGEVFGENAYLESDWVSNSKVHFKFGPDSIASTGLLSAVWPNTYIQIDYNFEGYHYAEKFLLLPSEKSNHTKLQVACGPYSEDIEEQKVVWNRWIAKVEELSRSF